MDVFLNSEIGRGITGIIISVVITLAALSPVIFMELFSNLLNVF
jgi:hypothetical protein